MKLFVWENVLHDYTAGMAVAVAPDLDTALRVLDAKASYDLNLPVRNLTVIDLEGTVIPDGWYVHGGG